MHTKILSAALAGALLLSLAACGGSSGSGSGSVSSNGSSASVSAGASVSGSSSDSGSSSASVSSSSDGSSSSTTDGSVSEPPADSSSSASASASSSSASSAQEPTQDPEPVPEPEPEVSPVEEAVKQYRALVDSPESIDYGRDNSFGVTSHRYALVQLQPDDPCPTLLMSEDSEDPDTFDNESYIRVFRYDPDSKTVVQSSTSLMECFYMTMSDIVSLYLEGDGNGLLSVSSSRMSPEYSSTRITMSGNSLQQSAQSGNATLAFIPWHDVSDESGLNWHGAPALETQTIEEMLGLS